jgi:drug/metabolite transporter (DMT)-like permease
VVSVVFALLTAAFNGMASVLQRRAAATAPPDKALHLSLLSYLVRHKIWLVGIVMTIGAALCQATALATGPVALVQPIFIIELPFTLLVASRMIGRKLPRLTWWAVGIVTISLGIGLAAASPSGGTDTAGDSVWIRALIVTAVFETVLLVIGVKAQGNARAAALGLAAACGYALTAALMKNAMAALDQGVVQFFSTWQLYATAVAGVGSLFILQNSLQAGPLVATQPALTLGDALISVSYGVTIFGETLRTGPWLIVEVFAVLAIGFGCIELSRSLGAIESHSVSMPQAMPSAEGAPCP